MSAHEWHGVRFSLLAGGLLHAGCVLALFAGLAMLPFTGLVQAVVPESPALWSAHRLAAAPVEIEALGHDGSGIAWHGGRNTLFAVRNRDPRIVELDTRGNALRSVTLQGFRDVEGITWLGGDDFAVLEERDCSVWRIGLPDGVQSVVRPRQPLFALPQLNPDQGNKGCEDLAWHAAGQVFYLSREKAPTLLLRVAGVDPQRPDASAITVQEMAGEQHGLFGSDIAGLHIEPASGQLLVLSDESRRLTGVSTGHAATLSAPFELAWWRNGGTVHIRQPEGVTMDGNGVLYVLSEPATLYRFSAD